MKKTLEFNKFNKSFDLRIFKLVKNQQGKWVKVPMEDIDFLKGANLEELQLNNCGLENIDALNNMDTLTHLSVEYNELCDISVLKTLPKLTWINASDNNISNITAINEIDTLVYANFAGNPVANNKIYEELREKLNKRRVKLGMDILTKEDMLVE